MGFTVKSMEKDFPISNYPLEQTEFLYDSKQGMMIKNKTLISHEPCHMGHIKGICSDYYFTFY